MVATKAYYAWHSRGRPYRLAPWVATAKRQAETHNVRWLGDLGNQAHLTASTPEDHTPFSYTAWPAPLPDYVVTAEDFARGDYCDKVLSLCRAGDRRVRFIKYMNFGGHHYNIKRGWRQESSSDEHWHISGLSTHTWTDIEPGFDLFAPDIRPIPRKVRPMWVFQLNQPNGKGGTESSWWKTNTLHCDQIMTWPRVIWHCQQYGQASPYDYQFNDLAEFQARVGADVTPDPDGVNIHV